ncbi:HNH endonuclease family protein [Streptomyces sp. NPDC006739]|uniref:HNH endonuclease family protein n=1 Tax=Streptomyces sp. NPDC006739 TaxID=3364763 RepID=UPI0036B28492
MHPSHAKRALVTAVVAALLAPASSAPAAAAASAKPVSRLAGAQSVRRDLPEPPPADVVRKELGELTVAAPHPMTGYSRSKFPHWITQYGTCDTREVVLARDGQGVIQDEQCRAISGTWYSAYDGKVSTRPSTEVDIDHVVPLANGWRSGADEWATAKRRQFANDLTNPQLIAVSASSNQQKGDQSPDQWAPPLRSYWCTYARAWTHVKYVYELNITEPEKSKLDEMLDTCPA